jgi:G:T/U-mismatch repair DNA glycosylase
MPYTLVHSKKKGDKRPWKIVRTDTNTVVGTSTSRKNAVGSLAHREDAMRAKGEMPKKHKKMTKKTKKKSKKK